MEHSDAHVHHDFIVVAETHTIKGQQKTTSQSKRYLYHNGGCTTNNNKTKQTKNNSLFAKKGQSEVSKYRLQ